MPESYTFFGMNQKSSSTKTTKSQEIHPGKLTCPLKRDYFNRKYIFQQSIFRGRPLVFGSVSAKNQLQLLQKLGFFHFFPGGFKHSMRCYHFLRLTCIDTEVAGWVVGLAGGWYPKTTGAVIKSHPGSCLGVGFVGDEILPSYICGE